MFKRHALLICSFVLALVGFLTMTDSAHANEGRFVLRNIVGGQSRCLAFSIDAEKDYQVIITCRGLVYPPNPPAIDRYIVWASDGDLKQPQKLGDLLRGNARATIKSKFNRIFVTVEDGDPKQPAGPVVMEGNIQDYDFQLTAQDVIVSTPTPLATNTPTIAPNQAGSPDVATPTPVSTEDSPSFWSTGFGKVIIIITAGFLIFIFIVIIYSRRV